MNEFQTSLSVADPDLPWIRHCLRLEGMSEIQARKSLLRLYFSRYLPAIIECNYKTEPFLLLCTKRRVLERNLSV